MQIRLTSEEYKEIIQDFENECNKHGMKLGHSFGIKNHNCCSQAISLTANGTLRNCPYLREYSNLGSFFNEDPIKLWNSVASMNIRNISNLEVTECITCKVYKQCRGGCPADKLLDKGTLFGKDSLCWL